MEKLLLATLLCLCLIILFISILFSNSLNKMKDKIKDKN